MVYSENGYEALIRDLFERHPSVQGTGFTPGAYKPGLQGMQAFDSSLGHPWKRYPCIHVAGTNGKGSVCSMLAAALAAGGLRVGLYTSPHLVDFRERMKIVSEDDDGGRFEMISREEVYAFLTGRRLDGLSFFEITTGMAFSWFADRGVDIAVIETGLGGRLDSTNIITPVLSVITSIGLDHCALLGDSVEKIAAEKAGIFKPGVSAVVWGRDSRTGPVFEAAAEAVGARLVFAGEGTSAAADSLKDDLLRRLDITGPCREANLRTVLTALEVLRGPGAATPAVRDAIASAASITGLRGRWERISKKPEVICDIGHNPQALSAGFAALESSGRPLHVVYGIMADKDLEGIAPSMPASAKWYLCSPATSRALPVADLADRLSRLRPGLDARAFPSVASAVKAAVSAAASRSSADEGEPLVYIGGSTFVVAEAMETLEGDPFAR